MKSTACKDEFEDVQKDVDSKIANKVSELIFFPFIYRLQIKGSPFDDILFAKYKS